MTDKLLDRFLRSYVGTALWSSNDESDDRGGELMDRNYGFEDIAPECLNWLVLAVSRDEIMPDSLDVIYSLLRDGDAIDSPTYESWAEGNGYDTDSRKGESIYRACLEIGLKLRAALGEAGLEKLRTAFQDY